MSRFAEKAQYIAQHDFGSQSLAITIERALTEAFNAGVEASAQYLLDNEYRATAHHIRTNLILPVNP